MQCLKKNRQVIIQKRLFIKRCYIKLCIRREKESDSTQKSRGFRTLHKYQNFNKNYEKSQVNEKEEYNVEYTPRRKSF